MTSEDKDIEEIDENSLKNDNNNNNSISEISVTNFP